MVPQQRGGIRKTCLVVKFDAQRAFLVLPIVDDRNVADVDASNGQDGCYACNRSRFIDDVAVETVGAADVGDAIV